MKIYELSLYQVTEDQDFDMIEMLMEDSFERCDHHAKLCQPKLQGKQYLEIFDDDTQKSWYYLKTGEIVNSVKQILKAYEESDC